MISRRQILVGAGSAVATLTGCASSPEPHAAGSRTYCMSRILTKRTVCTPERVPSAAVEADAMRFEATPGALTVYVVRYAWADAVRPLAVIVDGGTPIGTLPRSLIRLRLAPGTHRFAFEWDGRLQAVDVSGAAGDLRFIELAGSSVPLDRGYHWSDADPAGAKQRARSTRLIADAQWTTSAAR